MMWLALSALLLAQHCVNADTSVHILSKNYNQLITSSTLNWISESHYSASKELVIGGFETVPKEGTDTISRSIFVCRALHNGVWVAGARRDGENNCTVSLTGSVRTYERYQLLENVENAGRISWKNWTKYYTPVPGTVASSDRLYVARVTLEDEAMGKPVHYIGTLNAQDSLGIITYVKENGEESSSEKGQLLVETEPISYELGSVKLNNARSKATKRVPRTLGVATISNAGSAPGTMAEAFSYEYVYRLSWGQGHAMLRGLETKITLVNKTKLPDILWGIEFKENRTAVHTVEVHLEPGTAVNVTLHGTYATVETPYSGKLSSHYDDNSSINTRQIIDERQEDLVIDVTSEIGPVYFLGNFSLVPTPAPTPLAEPATTTTATSTTSRPETTPSLTTVPTTTRQQHYNLDDSQTEQQYSKENVGVDENSIVERPQGDDGGPQSLKDKNHDNSAANLSSALVTIVAAVLLTT
ncbi:protein unzipped isoform X2 [Phymastichus coffea]|uniref:protein unzipped isoform X2 n=1 Tax=Phymastichus coffea TaxID=108790 RepID=UPI00273BEC19|nr:protein unzipped isoform X2 [Phymastichus coffea]